MTPDCLAQGDRGKMFGLGMQELIIIFVIVLIVFGAKRLPEIGYSLGRGIKNFKKAFKDAEEEIDIDNNKIEDKDTKDK